MNKYHSEPHFYKYLDFRGALLTLQNRSLQFTNPHQFNDPFDFRPPLVMPLSADELRITAAKEHAKLLANGKIPRLVLEKARGKGFEIADFGALNISEAQLFDLLQGDDTFAAHFKSHFEATHEKSVQFLHDALSEHFVCCLTTNPKNLLMWSHYADKHQGAVLQFNCLPDLDNCFLAAQKVQYLDNPPTFGTRESWEKLIRDGSPADHRELFNTIVNAKSREWEHEDEWRVSIWTPGKRNQKHDYVNFGPKELASITFGCGMRLEEKNVLLELIKRNFPNTRIFQAEKSTSAFELDFMELNRSTE